MRISPIILGLACGLIGRAGHAADFQPAPQKFQQETARKFTSAQGVGSVQLVELAAEANPRIFADGKWSQWRDNRWQPIPELAARSENEFVFADNTGAPVTVTIPWREVIQVLRQAPQIWIATAADPFTVVNGQAKTMGWPSKYRVNQIASAPDGSLYMASSGGLFKQVKGGWTPLGITDDLGRAWAVQNVMGVAFDAQNQLWFATKAGVGCQTKGGWRFFEGKDGLPWNDFTGIATGADQSIWFGTRLGVIRYDGREWQYRQGLRWLPHDEVHQIAVDPQGNAWCGTAGGLGIIERKAMTLAQKAAVYEEEIARYVKRTPYGYVAEAPLRAPGDKASANPEDSDNDGLWTAMYGAGECFAAAATGDASAKQRAKQAFEALRFLQKVTQGGPHSPPKGYVARTIRPSQWPDPNAGRFEQDKAENKQDPYWKVYKPRWPKSADGQWYWKSDTSSDELDGHFFFYPLYFDFCADSKDEKDRVREVVRDLADHLVTHRFALIDHDGQPTRWAVFGPESLNLNARWWPERGLNSLSILTYLAVAAHITGDAKYEEASRELIEKHGYAQNAMYPKVQQGPGSGNQSDDEMAFMCYYNLLRYSRNESLKAQIRFSFYRYWANEAPEMNPFFNFAYAAHTLTQTKGVFSRFSFRPWPGWHDDSMATLYGFPLDRLNWSHQNRHRLDVDGLKPQQASDLYEGLDSGRGRRVNGKVLPVENRHFNHWNTDPWALNYSGNGNELAAGTVFLLPYYLGLYHGFIEKP